MPHKRLAMMRCAHPGLGVQVRSAKRRQGASAASREVRRLDLISVAATWTQTLSLLEWLMPTKHYRPWNPEQLMLFPPDMRDALEEGHLAPMMDRVRHNTRESPEILSADTGYMSEANIAYCEDNGIDAYLAVGRKPKAEDDETTESEKEAWRRMREKLGTVHGSEVYARRKAIVEPVFGHAKEARSFRRFSLRGLDKVRAEWTLVCLCGNLLKLIRYSSVEQLATVS